MHKHTMKLLWLFLILSCGAAYQVVFGKVEISQQAMYVYYYVFAAALLSWAYLTARIFIFRKKLMLFIRHIMENEYAAGIKISRLSNDEVSELSRRINTMAERLMTYDTLQRDRIFMNTCALDIIYRTVKEGIILFDVAKREFRFNPVVQGIFEVEQETIAYEAIARQSGNGDFIELLKLVVEKGDLVANSRVRLGIPVRQTRRDLAIRIVPVKNKHEAVELAIMFVSAAP